MLGIATSMEDEQKSTPEKEPKLPVKPQKTLITSFFKQKDCPKKTSNSPKDLFGYFKKSATSGGQISLCDTDCENGLNDSLDDFQDPPRKAKTPDICQVNPVVEKSNGEKLKSKKKKRKPQLKDEGQELVVTDKKMQSVGKQVIVADKNSDLVEISYEDFLKGGIGDDATEEEGGPEECNEIPYTDFLKSQGLTMESNSENESVVDASPLKQSENGCEASSMADTAEMVESIGGGVLTDPNLEVCKGTLDVAQPEISVSTPLESKHISYKAESTLQNGLTEIEGESHRHEIKVISKSQQVLSMKKCKLKIKSDSAEVVNSETDVEQKHLPEKVMTTSDNNGLQESISKHAEDKPKMKAKGSITSFFTKIEFKDRKMVKKEDSSVITTEAVVHPTPDEVAGTKPVSSNAENRRSPVGKSNVAVDGKDVDWSITQLESVVITVPEKRKKNIVMSPQYTEPAEVADMGKCKEQEHVETDLMVALQPAVAEVDTKSEHAEDDLMELSKEEPCSVQGILKKRLEKKQQNAACIASLDDVGILLNNNKRKQATLSFTNKGLLMGKPLASEPLKEVESEAVHEAGEPKATIQECSLPQKPVDSEDDVSVSEATDSSLITLDGSPVVQKWKWHTKLVTSTPVVDGIGKTKKAVSENAKGRTTLNSVFATSIVRTPPGRKRVILKFKFKHYKSNSDDDFTSSETKQKKQTTSCAQKLLMKALSKKLKTSPMTKKPLTKKSAKLLVMKNHLKPLVKRLKKPAKSDDKPAELVPLRRSSRSSAQVAKVAISESFEEKSRTPKTVDREGRKEAVKKSKKTPTQDAKGKTQKNSAVKKAKMAAIFCGKKTSLGSMSPIIIVDDDPQEDTEAVRIRKQFLMSGVPTALRKQQVFGVAGTTDLDYAPFPVESHIRQVEAAPEGSAINPWSLPAVSLNLRANPDNSLVVAKPWHTGILVKTNVAKKPTECNKCEVPAVESFAEAMMPYLLAEASRFNPAYPVRRIFKQLQRANTDQISASSLQDNSFANVESAMSKEDPLVVEKGVKPVKGKKRKQPEPAAASEVKTRQSKRHRGSAEPSCTRRSMRHSSQIQPAEEDEEEVVEIVNLDAEQEDGARPEATPGDSSTKSQKEQTDHNAPFSDSLWTEKYEPNTGSEVLGNSGCIRRLKTWLVEWKQHTDLELRRARKQILKQAKRAGKSREDIKKEIKTKLGSDWCADDDEDFELGSDDSDSEFEEEQDSRLCNSTLLIGPHGVGKTAAVYALAKELGYKVFEVNASSRRSGRQMLAQLQEATQSHQVSQKNMDAMFTTSMAAQAIVEKVPTKSDKSVSNGFANLFGKAKPKTESKPSGARRQKEAKTKNGDALKKCKVVSLGDLEVSKRGLDLSSTSLVLFEEVDVIFEEDKGFWAAIQTFMMTTKRPMILTASGDGVSRLVEARHETLKMRTPPLVNIATHLQLVCLAEKMRTSFHDLHALVQFHRGDLRRCLHELQFWATSNTCTDMITDSLNDTPVMYHPDFFTRQHYNGALPAATAPLSPRLLLQSKGDDSESDFEMLAMAKSKRRRCPRNMIEDDSSRDSILDSPRHAQSPDMASLNEDSQSRLEPYVGESTGPSCELLTAPATLTAPLLHRKSFEAIEFSQSAPGGVLSFLQAIVENPSSADTSILKHYEEHGFNPLYANLPSLLGLPCVAPVRRPSMVVLGVKNKTRRRIKCAAELFGSDEESDEEFVSLKKKTNMDVVEKAGSNTDKEPDMQSAVKTETASTADHILATSIRSLAAMYDAFSFADAYLCIGSELHEGDCHVPRHFWSSGKVFPGLSDQGPRYLKTDHFDKAIIAEAACVTKMAAVACSRTQLAKCVRKTSELKAEPRDVVHDRLSLPQEGTELRLASEFSIYQNLQVRHQRACEYVCSVLPPHVQLEKQVVALDYIPALQTICRSEQLRRATNTKRRFLHYMDSISLPLNRKSQIVDALCSAFL